MASRSGGVAAIVTLVLSTLLHAFTHAFGAMLVPLYLMMQADLHLNGVKPAAMIVTIYGTVYAILSYPAGVLADRVSRKRMLGVGLVLNALAIICIGLTRRYDVMVMLAVLCGIAGTVFHPAANALVPEHFPKSPGMAIGLLGIGSGLGFFAGPQYAGWRAETARWHWHAIADWQRPCIEMGVGGLALGVLFLLFAKEARDKAASRQTHISPPLGPKLRKGVALTATILACRDFAGVASLSLASIYLQKAMKFDAKTTGLIVGTMMLVGVFANPLAVWLSPGKRRLPALSIVLVLAGCIVALTPLFSTRLGVLVILCLFQACQLGSYAMSDAGMLERVPASVRGRVVGLFLTIAGTFAGLSPWVMGIWTDAMGAGAEHRLSYIGPFATLGAMMIIAAFSTPVIARLGKADPTAIKVSDEIVPATLEAV